MNISDFEKLPLMGILRGISSSSIKPLVETMVKAGLKSTEIAMNTPGAAEIIRKAVRTADGRMDIGAGTVLSKKILDAAIRAGANFIVMPACVDEVMSACKKKNIPVFPGALTPHEIFAAHRAGAAMVKVFPAGLFGPAYFKELRGPYDDIKLMAVGGVRADNIRDFFAAGANAVAFGASVFRNDLLEAGDFKAIGRAVAEYIAVYRGRTPETGL